MLRVRTFKVGSYMYLLSIVGQRLNICRIQQRLFFYLFYQWRFLKKNLIYKQ